MLDSKNKKTTRFTLTSHYSQIPMAQGDWEATEELLASMIARAIAADHPEWFWEGES